MGWDSGGEENEKMWWGLWKGVTRGNSWGGVG